ncbi:MAG: hypothetical protein HY263_01080 [Chloroflexi bacterium]|nr:hypothetical protein [Chloroflexota bacterium]
MTTTSRRRRPRPSPRRRVATVIAAAEPSVTPATILGTVPSGLRDPLLAALNEIATNFAAHKWEPSELNGGKLCETAYTILRSHVDGKWATKPSKPGDFKTACFDFEKTDKKVFPQSVRITTPRVMMALYEIRNNRGVGHAGDDVDPNHMDATLVLAGAKWVVAELVRIFHNVTTTEATAVVDALVERVVPAVWAIGTTRRVLVPGMSMKEQTLLLLYGPAGWVSEASLVTAVEHSNPSIYRRDVLVKAHKDRLIEYDGDQRRVHITPLGIEYVEKKLAAHLIA